MQKTRINTKIGGDQKITINLEQNFDLLEILSLKLTQKDVYSSLCSDYGVVCGRISINNGLGVPNARISIFIPLSENDEDDPVISALYPFKTVTDRNEEGFRYNLLPDRKQHGGHEPTGSFPDQLDILSREEILEVYEKYYKFTVKTNNSGDFMIWGVPIGEQTIHIDVDFSDIGCFSLRPDDFLRKGYGVDSFKSTYEFKSSSDIDSLPQIGTYNKSIEVYPFWGSEDLCEIGITRVDYDLSSTGVIIEPKALIIGGTFTDSGKNLINKNCTPRKNMGTKCTLETQAGKVESIRFTTEKDELNRPILEEYKVNEDINSDGSFAFAIPMNMDYLYTNEFGENEYTNDSNKGVATSACYRFRFSLKDAGLERNRLRASYLAPNIREFNDDVTKSYAWSTDLNDYPDDAIDNIILNSTDGFYYPQDYFYRFQYGKVYTISSFQNTLFTNGLIGGNRMLGIKDIAPSEDKDCSASTLTPPVNFAIKNNGFNFQLLLSSVITFVTYVTVSAISLLSDFIGSGFKIMSTLFRIGTLGFKNPLSNAVLKIAYSVQSAGQLTLPLTIYDICDPCPTDEDKVTGNFIEEEYLLDTTCKIGEMQFDIKVMPQAAFDSLGKPTVKFSFALLVKDTFSDTTNGTSKIFTDSPARECVDSPNCCGAYLLSNSVDVLSDLNNLVTSEDTPRFVLGISQNTHNSFSQGNLFYPYYRNFTPIFDPSFLGYGIIFSEEEAADLFGIPDLSTYTYDNGYPTYGYVLDTSIKKVDSTSDSSIFDSKDGCEVYNDLYNENTTTAYLWFKGDPEYNSFSPVNKDEDPINETDIKELEKGTYPSGTGWTIGASVWYKNKNQNRLPREYKGEIYNRKTKTGYSEFRNGIFYIVPSVNGVSLKNLAAIREWYKRQIIGLNFCGGIVSYSFIDNWLSGSLYFFQFKGKIKEKRNEIKVKACHNLVQYIPEHEKFYYRSSPYKYDPDPTREIWGENIINDNIKSILHPTTFIDLGPRDEFIKDICTDKTLDPNSAVARSIGSTSYKPFNEIVAFAINYKMDIDGGETKISDFFDNSGFMSSYENTVPLWKRSLGIYFPVLGIASALFSSNRYFDGDILQLLSINSEAGIEGFDVDNPKYLGYNMQELDADNFSSKNIFTDDDGKFGPTPITLEYEDDGVRIRKSLNAKGYLTESAQRVPFYLWNKRGPAFGPHISGDTDNQSWDYDGIHVDYLQGMASYQYRYNTSSDPDIIAANLEDSYLLPPMSQDYKGNIVSGKTLNYPEEFDEVVLDSDFNYNDDLAKDYYKFKHHNFKLLIATSGTTLDPLVGTLYIRLDDDNTRWSDPIYWDSSYDYSIYPTEDPYKYDTELNLPYRQILSTPFLFYFGLRPGKTGIDLLTERFGAKGSFTFTDDTSIVCVPPSPTIIIPTPTPTITPTPSTSPPPISYFFIGSTATYANPTLACSAETDRGYYLVFNKIETGDRLYEDMNLTTLVNGGGNWIKLIWNFTIHIAVKVEIDGEITSIYTCNI